MRAKAVPPWGFLVCAGVTFACQGALAEQSWFVGAAYGYESHNTSLNTEEGSIGLLFEPEDDGTTLAVEIGYHFNKSLFSTVEYSHFDADDTEIDNLFVTLNYGWPVFDNGLLYVGAVAGGSRLEWQDAPIQTLRTNNESDTFLWGGQIGYQHLLSEHWRINARYQYLGAQH